MAGIPLHTSSPINASQPSHTGIPATAVPTQVENGPPRIAATTTTSTPLTQAARPGAAAPTPTSTAASAYTPPSPTRTEPLPATTSGPPLPQPGQAPTPQTHKQDGIPPPPTASQSPRVAVPPIQTQSAPKYPPPLAASPRLVPPGFAYAQPPAGVTSISRDLSHPPGYIQDHGASFSDRVVEPENRTHSPSPTRAGRGILDGEPILRGDGDGTGSPVWETAMNWAKEAGKKLSEAESEVWKTLSGGK